MAASIMVQAIDSNNDPIESGSGPVFLSDIDAVAQIICTSLKLLQGEWWENLDTGYPLVQQILGASGSDAQQKAVMLLTQQYILAAAPPFVLRILSYTYTYNSALRSATWSAQVLTSFGTLTVTNAPGNSVSVSS